MGLGAAEITCDLILSCPRYKHLASSRLLSSSAHDQRQPETNDCNARERRDTEGGASNEEEEEGVKKKGFRDGKM